MKERSKSVFETLCGSHRTHDGREDKKERTIPVRSPGLKHGRLERVGSPLLPDLRTDESRTIRSLEVRS